MMTILVHILELGVLAGFGLMVGAAIYSSVVEVPVRQILNPRGQLMNWQSVFPVASGFLKPFGTGLFPLAIVIGFLSGV